MTLLRLWVKQYQSGWDNKEIAMTRTNLLDMNKFSPFVVGFDRFFDQMLDSQAQNTNYPPYNISKNDNEYCIEIALAGISKEDIALEVTDSVLSVSYTPEPDEAQTVWLHRGIAKRGFTHKFTIAKDIKVMGAEMDNGLLCITLEREIPETKKPKQILIS